MPAHVGCAWRLLSDATQADLLQCQCGCGEQNAGHVWHQCMYTDHMRIAVVDAATRVVGDLASARDRAWWHGLDAAECVAHVVSSKCVMDDVTERMLRSVCVPLVVSSFEEAMSDLENDGFYSGVCDMAA